jgi:hypothetical protein
MAARVLKLPNAVRAIASTGFVATQPVRDFVTRVRQRKKVKAPTARVVPLRSPRIPTTNARKEPAMVRAPAKSTTARRAVFPVTVCPGIASTMFVAAALAPARAWRVQPRNAAPASMANAA